MKTTMRTLCRLFALAICLSCAGCIFSGLVVGTGKGHEHLNHRSVKLEKVRQDLGDPAYSRIYKPTRPISLTEEYKALTKAKGYTPSVRGDGDTSKNERTALCEVYSRIGPFADMNRGQGYGMASGLTLGVADIVLLPTAIKERSELNKEKFSITFWYDQEMRVIGTYKGDIRSKTSHW